MRKTYLLMRLFTAIAIVIIALPATTLAEGTAKKCQGELDAFRKAKILQIKKQCKDLTDVIKSMETATIANINKFKKQATAVTSRYKKTKNGDVLEKAVRLLFEDMVKAGHLDEESVTHFQGSVKRFNQVAGDPQSGGNQGALRSILVKCTPE